ncbi:Aste57867_23290 [Aphanomyces stellatus]|uniref:Aste57867_23290 protein n=1 Tax=Aphanomyces stellatus TaxID=120398 RepID=A0A485LP72_9STRA|nr:hypothetical protein As57867_023219 [Aphanomyces stellatus]VFT99935.1 Aste57867_23290 [Aphanomyces stellatus]
MSAFNGWKPSCAVHVPEELIPEAMEFEENLRKYGVSTSALYDARMASYEAEFGPEKKEVRRPAPPLPKLDIAAMRAMVDPFAYLYCSPADGMSHLSTNSYDSVVYSPVGMAPLSGVYDDEFDELDLVTPTVSASDANESCCNDPHMNLHTGLSSVMDVLCVSPQMKRVKKTPQSKTKATPKRSSGSSFTTGGESSFGSPLAKKKPSGGKKRKAVVQLRRD